MCRHLVATNRDQLEWDLPSNEIYDETINMASAMFVETNIEDADVLQWSSIGQLTGVGMFLMATARMDLVEQFRLLIRNMEHPELEFETFPKASLLEAYGLTLHLHRGMKHFRPITIVHLL